MATTAKTDDAPNTIGIKQLADHLSTDPRKLRSWLRRTERAVGRGTRYEWPSLSDPAVENLAADWRAAQPKAKA